MTRRTLFIINPAAGADRGHIRWTEFQRHLQPPATQANQVLTERPGEAAQIAREAAAEYDLLVAVGGDGTAFEVADGLLSSATPRTALAIVPMGTGNDLAAVLGIHTEAEARRALAGGQTRPVDVIEVHCVVDGAPAVRHALLFAGVGIAGEALKRTTPLVKRLFGRRLAYPVGLLRALWRYQPPRMRVTCDGEVFTQRFLFAGASNSELAGGSLRLAPGAQMDDGLLNVNLVEAVSRWRALRQLRPLSQGRHTTHPNVRYRTALSLAVEAEPPLDVAADGNLVGHTPARFQVKPKALLVVVPAR